MSIDFRLDNQGDFLISTPPLHNRLRLDWYDSDYPVLRINFEQGQEYPPRIPKPYRIRIDFTTDKSKEIPNRRFTVLSGVEEIKQRIMIRLRTEKDEIPYMPNFGSYLATQKHEDLLSDRTKNMIENIVYNEVVDILKDPRVIAVPKRSSGTFYCQNIHIYVYEGNELYFDIDL